MAHRHVEMNHDGDGRSPSANGRVVASRAQSAQKALDVRTKRGRDADQQLPTCSQPKEKNMSRIALVLAALAVTFILATTGSAEAKSKRLSATVGPGFTISMSAKSVKPGTYTITVKDLSNIHNFHLIGRGVNQATSVPAVKTTTWKVTLKKGTYRFICDPHASFSTSDDDHPACRPRGSSLPSSKQKDKS